MAHKISFPSQLPNSQGESYYLFPSSDNISSVLVISSPDLNFNLMSLGGKHA